MFNIAQFELIVNIVKTSQGVYALGGLFIYVMYNVKNYECVTVTHSYLSVIFNSVSNVKLLLKC